MRAGRYTICTQLPIAMLYALRYASSRYCGRQENWQFDHREKLRFSFSVKYHGDGSVADGRGRGAARMRQTPITMRNRLALSKAREKTLAQRIVCLAILRDMIRLFDKYSAAPFLCRPSCALRCFIGCYASRMALFLSCCCDILGGLNALAARLACRPCIPPPTC